MGMPLELAAFFGCAQDLAATPRLGALLLGAIAMLALARCTAHPARWSLAGAGLLFVVGLAQGVGCADRAVGEYTGWW